MQTRFSEAAWEMPPAPHIAEHRMHGSECMSMRMGSLAYDQSEDHMETSGGSEEELYSGFSKLYRFVDNDWKEEGNGHAYLLKQKQTGKARFMFLQEKTMNVIGNHLVVDVPPYCDLLPNAGGSTCWVWTAQDLAGVEMKVERLALKFGTSEKATAFKDAFENAKQLIKDVAWTAPKSNLHVATSQEQIAELADTGEQFEQVQSKVSEEDVDIVDELSRLQEQETKVANPREEPDADRQRTAATLREPRAAASEEEAGEYEEAQNDRRRLQCQEELSECLLQHDTDEHERLHEYLAVAQAEKVVIAVAATDSVKDSVQHEELEIELEAKSIVQARDETQHLETSLMQELVAREEGIKQQWQRMDQEDFEHGFSHAKTQLQAAVAQVITDDKEGSTAESSAKSLPNPHMEINPKSIPNPYMEINPSQAEVREDEIFSQLSKLYRFDGKTWEEKGLGEAKLLKDTKTRKVRFMMQQEKTMKVLCNHLVVRAPPYCDLLPSASGDPCWVWTAQDFADDGMKVERFALKFNTSENAKAFKDAFEHAKQADSAIDSDTVRQSGAQPRIRSQEPPTSDVWYGVVRKTACKRAGEECTILIHDSSDPQLSWKVQFKDGTSDWFREQDIVEAGSVDAIEEEARQRESIFKEEIAQLKERTEAGESTAAEHAARSVALAETSTAEQKAAQLADCRARESEALVEALKAKLDSEITWRAEGDVARKRSEEALAAAHHENLCLEDSAHRMEEERCERAEAQASMLEEQSAAWRESEQLMRQELLKEADRRHHANSMWRKASQDLLRNEEEASVQKAEDVVKKRKGLLACFVCRRSRSLTTSETQELVADLKRFSELAQNHEQEAVHQAKEEQMAQQELIVSRRRFQEHEALSANEVFEEACERFEETRRQEALQVEAREHEAEVEARQARDQIINTTIALVHVPMAVRIPRFSSVPGGLIGSKVSYTIHVEGPGTTLTLEKSFSDFKALHEELREKPFAQTLQSVPQDWFYTSFSTMMKERRRRQLEAYLSFLCTHPRVLLDPVVWRWLGIEKLTEVVVRLVAAKAVQWASEVSDLVETLEALVDSGVDMNRCIHPAILGALQDLISDVGDENTQANACRLLSRLLVGSARARQLFFAVGGTGSSGGGAEALLQACHGRGGLAKAAASETIKKALAAFSAEAEEQTRVGEAQQASQGEGARRSQSSVDDEPACCVCLDRDKSHALLPCGHLCTCMNCANDLEAQNLPCPVCRRPIEQAVQIFV